MFNFTKTDPDELFLDSSLSDYSVIVTEIRDENGAVVTDDYLTEILNACSNLMNASFVDHYCEKAGNMIICFLNYNSSVFSIRSFVGSLRQTMYSISQKNRSYVCYAEDLQDKNQLYNECIFLINAVRYGILLGGSRPFTSTLLHRLEQSTEKLPRDIAFSIMQELNDKKYDKIITEFGQMERSFLNIFEGGVSYPFPEMMNYISEICTALRLFFEKQDYHFTFMDEDIFTILYKNNGCAGLIRLLSGSLEKYRANFSLRPSSEREQKNMDDILAHIADNLATATLSETAAHFDLTDAYLCRLFKKNMGVNFTEYIKEKKLETALRLLQGDEKMTVSAISQAIGMKSQSHFQNVFKNEFGITPEAYRRNYRLNKPE
ncbi:MAG: AraC family transcriptional regulator [Lachnospiraceae bacterium]|nr:AraC family transcriptional regulator [Lachnospiraceae bacterium]